jgi:hypothetical protein
MRWISITAPVLMLVYGVLRWVDGRDGQRKDDLAWDAGHVSFLVAMVLFAVLAVLLAHRSPRAPRLAAAAAAVAVFGAGCFVWVILGDLFEAFPSLIGALDAAGPVLFVLGMVTLLGLHVAAGRVPAWSPVLFFAGNAAAGVSLDLLPLAALLVLAATVPLARSAAGPPPAGPVRTRLRQS